MEEKEELKKLKEEIIAFFESDKQFIKDNMDILDEILDDIYNLHR